MEFLGDDKNGDYDCDKCIAKKLFGSRNCDGSGLETDVRATPPYLISVYGTMFDACPLTSIDIDAAEVVNIVRICEGGGFGGGRITPSSLLEETAFYWNARGIVNSKQASIEKIREEKRKKENGGRHN